MILHLLFSGKSKSKENMKIRKAYQATQKQQISNVVLDDIHEIKIPWYAADYIIKRPNILTIAVRQVIQAFIRNLKCMSNVDIHQDLPPEKV